MIKIYTSNNFNYLIKKICKKIYEKKTNNIFVKEILVIENSRNSEFLKQKISKILGISSNINFFTQKQFIFYILKQFTYKKKIINFNQSMIFWKLINLSKNNKKKLYQIKKNELEEFEYFKNLSKIFEEYLFHRSNWIIKWEYKKKEKKKYNKIYYIQKKIWKKITKNNKKKNIYHYINLYKEYFKKNLKKKYIYKKFPSKIFIINPFNFPNFFLKILKKISKKIKIYIFLCTPFDIREKTTKKNWEKYSILSLWTKNHLNKIKFLQSLTNKKKFFYIKHKNNSLLNKIKNNFLLLRDLINIDKKKIIKKIDKSITIHECNNYLREIEILHENISKLLMQNKNIQPKDIIIKSEKIKNYIPYIKSVFKTKVKENNIPYNIHTPLFEKNSILYIFNKILLLPKNKFKNENILDFLYFKCIAKKFSISQKEIKRIKEWIKNTNIRWGINANHKKKIGIYPTSQNTWEYGIKKIILGYGIKENIKKWKKIKPYNIYEKDQIELFEKLVLFIKTCIKWQKKLQKKNKNTKWIKIYKKIIKDFFYLNKKNKKKIKIITKNWIQIIQEIQNISYKKKISINILQYTLNDKLKKIYYNKKINNNCINFTDFNFLRTKNFKITYCLGMNENIFPQKIIKNHENLIYKYKKPYDFKKHQDIFFIFFELLSFTEKKIYISYINNSPSQIEKNEISNVIQKLKKYLENNFFFKEKIFKKNFFVHPATNFEKKKIFNQINYSQHQSLWLLKKKNFLKKNFVKKIPLSSKIKKINIKKLISFWKNPINYFFNKILKIYYRNNKFVDYNQEPFMIDIKTNYLLQKKILKYMILKKNYKKLFNKIKSIGVLPHKNFGKIHFDNQILKVKKVYLKIQKKKTKFLKKKFSLKIKKFHIYGKLKNISKNELIRWKVSPLNYYDTITLWLEHLIHCILGGKKSTYLGINKNISFKKISRTQAKKNLLKYILGYIQGLQKPIILTKTGLNWFHLIFDHKEKKISKKFEKIQSSEKKIFSIWHGNKYSLGEKKNLYLKKIIPLLNNKIIQKIKRITKYWMLPIYKNLI
ncbi:RecBCD enzyme subunit RecC [Buchnera aphidicola (Sipha maydis)]|uniref:exodeoxyribonuclease V subunit gamma n=1 Tax=Buchnera aphidicola TaxID=9 RepID=UPI003463B08B